MMFSQESNNGNSGIIFYKMKDGLPNGSFHYINAELYFNKNESLFIFNKIGIDDIQHGNSLKTFKSDKKAVVSMSFSSTDKKGFIIYRNFLTKQIILRFTDAFPFEPYTVQDKWIPFKWTIMDEGKKILGFRVQKAITQFRGRIYTAWFTREIPVTYGPWKFFGLPGLILEVYDSTKMVEFTLTKICYPCKIETDFIVPPIEKEEKAMKEHVYIHDYYNEMMLIKFNEIYKKTGNEGGFIYGKQTNLKDIQKNRKTRFEIIYEWEDYPGDTESPYDETLIEKAFESVPQKVRTMDEEASEKQTQIINQAKEIKK